MMRSYADQVCVCVFVREREREFGQRQESLDKVEWRKPVILKELLMYGMHNINGKRAQWRVGVRVCTELAIAVHG